MHIVVQSELFRANAFLETRLFNYLYHLNMHVFDELVTDDCNVLSELLLLHYSGCPNHPLQHTFHLLMHAVCIDSSTTTNLQAVFNASGKSSTGVSLEQPATRRTQPAIRPDTLSLLK